MAKAKRYRKDPRYRPGGKKRQCTGHTRSGRQCSNTPIIGGTVCRMHGGGAPQVKRKAQERLEDLIDPNRLLRELAGAVYSDLREAFDEHGKLRPMHEWPEALARAVASVKTMKKNLQAGDGKTDDVVEIRLWDKMSAITLLMRHLKMLTDKVEHTGRDGQPLVGPDPRTVATAELIDEAKALVKLLEGKVGG